jgi:Icc-related predicted phosphoesterase
MTAAASTPYTAPRRVPQPKVADQHFQHPQAFAPTESFQPLPVPTGQPPYRLDLGEVLGADAITAIQNAGKLIIHVNGDSGGVKDPNPQLAVAKAMAAELTGDATGPSFFYHVGDVVYFNGDAADYTSQFYEAYNDYSAPILAIPGNHDGDPSDPTQAPSLQAFVNNFCAPAPRRTQESGEFDRDAMDQPNVYWTLTAPFVTIIGLYSNVPSGGQIAQDQIDWLTAELAAADPTKALFVAVHHPPYSADAHHGGSQHIGDIIDGAVDNALRQNPAARRPDMVLTGHVHDYQRFTRTLDSGEQVPYIVAGAGGYHNLHLMAKDSNGGTLQTPWQTPDPGVVLESYADDDFGYLRLEISAATVVGTYSTVGYKPKAPAAGVRDTFTLDLKAHTVG